MARPLGRARLCTPGRPDGGEQDADDLDVVVGVDDVAPLEEVAVAEGEDDKGDVENDGEDEVEDGDPEERLEALKVRSWRFPRKGVSVGSPVTTASRRTSSGAYPATSSCAASLCSTGRSACRCLSGGAE